jgi:hypothetical protein
MMASGGHPRLVVFTILHSVITVWQMYKLVSGSDTSSTVKITVTMVTIVTMVVTMILIGTIVMTVVKVIIVKISSLKKIHTFQHSSF